MTTNEQGYLRKRPQHEDLEREASRAAELDAFKACNFQQGFASEGMLCNEPPIPLRALHYLEARDLVRLSLVCKRTHHAAHALLTREVSTSPINALL
jgi:hypothetical protein